MATELSLRGADSGIGRAVALAFAREGADVLISYLSEDRDAEETKRLVEEAGRLGDRRPRGHSGRSDVPEADRSGDKGVRPDRRAR